ncbi:hypothetical protein Tco_0590743 [Tanacetum coccineum]
MARKVQEEWEGEEERKRLAKEEATNESHKEIYDDIMARIEADILFAEKLHEEEREQFAIEEREKFLHDTIVSSPDGDYLVIYRANGNFRAFNYLIEIVTWRLYESCGVCILEFKDGIVIHMLVERRYPLSKDLLQRMLDLGLEVERESFVALDLIRFIKQQIDEEWRL